MAFIWMTHHYLSKSALEAVASIFLLFASIHFRARDIRKGLISLKDFLSMPKDEPEQSTV